MTNGVITASQEDLGTCTVISVDYGEDTIRKAINAGGVENEYLYVRSVRDIPLGGTGRARHEVFELHLGEIDDNSDLLDELDERNLALVDPLTALRYAAKLPDRQRKHPLSILFKKSKKKEYCYLTLFEEENGERSLHVGESADRSWSADHHFLVVPKKAVTITVNYSRNAIDDAIAAANFDYYISHVDEDDLIPLGGTGRARHEVFEVHLWKAYNKLNLPEELDERNLALVDPLTALRYAAKLPNRQRNCPLITIFSNKKGKLCHLTLSEKNNGGGEKRYLDVYPGFPDPGYLTMHRLLVEKKC
jgi:hypothetical protein